MVLQVLQLASYEWHPWECNLQAFSAQELDRKLAGKRVAFIGDSIHLQQFYSFKHLMGEVTAGPQPAQWGHFFTHSGAQFTVQAAQLLVGQQCCNQFQEQSLEVLPDAEWMALAQQADILVLNTGHHWHRRDAAWHSWPAMVRNVMQRLQADFKGSHIIYRTSSWGHHRCPTITQPLPTLDDALEYMENDPYHWFAPIHSEHLWQAAANDLGMGHRFRYVNASMTLLRGDSHLDRQMDSDGSAFDDCLHYCPLAGPPDYWNWVLFNTLMQLDL